MGWKTHLDEYYQKYKYNFIVQKMTDFPHPWLNYGTPEYEEFIKKNDHVSQREVFYDEVVFDIDMDKELNPIQARGEAEIIAKIISERLKESRISHEVWSSGGTGVHIHSFFPELLKLNSVDNRVMKKIVLKHFGQSYVRPRASSGKVQLQSNTTIQLEAAPHRKGGKKKFLWKAEFEQPNTLSLEMFNELEEEKKRNNLMAKYFKENMKDNKPEAIVFLENEKFMNVKDGRDRALFILTAYYKQFLKDDELLAHLTEWNKKVLGGYFTERVIKAKIRSARPCLPVNYLIDLFDELDLDVKYLKGLKHK